MKHWIKCSTILFLFIPTITLCNNQFAPHAYLSFSSGYAYTGWDKNLPDTYYTMTKNKDGGFVWGGDLGYQLNPWLGVELGAQKLPTTELTYSSAAGKIKAISYHVTGKMSHDINQTLSIFTKAGISLQYTSIDNISSLESNYSLGSFFGAGIGYSLLPQWQFNLEVRHADGQSDHDQNKYAADPTSYLVSINYRFI